MGEGGVWVVCPDPTSKMFSVEISHGSKIPKVDLTITASAQQLLTGQIESLWADICGSVKRLNFSFSDYVILVCKFGELSEVKDVYDRIFMDGGSCCLDRQSYVALSAALCSLNEGFLAKNVVNEMYDKGMADLALRKLVKNGFVVDICVYGSWIHGLCKSGKYREADKLFRKLLKRGSVKKFGEEKKELKEGRRAIFQLNCEGVVPELMAYECYFRALCNAMKLDDAEVLLKKMMSGRALPEICVYGSFIKALFRSGRDEDAMKFFKAQRKKGLVRVDEIVTYVIMGLCENGKSDDALRLFDEILTVNGFVNGSYVCNIILGSYWKHDGVSKAELFFERWRLNEGRYGKLDVTSYTIMFNGYCSGNDVRKAVMVFEEMLKRKMAVNGALYERVIRLLCDRGRANEAFRYAVNNGDISPYRSPSKISVRISVLILSAILTDITDISPIFDPYNRKQILCDTELVAAVRDEPRMVEIYLSELTVSQDEFELSYSKVYHKMQMNDYFSSFLLDLAMQDIYNDYESEVYDHNFVDGVFAAL
ncbi:pentatricopeptide repeat-containing protein At5g41170, mitochondrial-like [Helianthus annuus]|uniref:pentatricopeptide repeat-containing protein At5g41170, mitochondrial-like n=1 Tax=Helianthus annuus TaxID=4232 RepID=UPI00165307DA|nr:pentatricopeptide repeat-containing protein At5g41170, mitochondrial-like [Helianthus annuus]